ncbi:retrotransposon protein, putative, ty1-copia subclass [Tanacetum coccineum]
MFQEKVRKECLDVVKSLMACKPKPGASICAFILEMKGYFNRLESLNMEFDAELSINMILSSLSADYNQFVLSYQMNRKETSIMELHSLLQTAEQGIKKIDVPSTSAALVLTVGHNAKKRKTSYSNWKGKVAQGKSDRRSKKKAEYEIAPTSDPKEAGLKESRRLTHRDLNLVMGNRKITLVTRIGNRYGYVYLIKHKLDTFKVFKRYQNEVENQLGRKIKLTPPRTPQLNGVAERRNRTLLDMVRSMMCQATLLISFWGYALETVAHILNLVPTKKVSKIPFEMWKGKCPSLGHIKIWDCEVFVRREAQDKLEARSEKCLFIGYPKESFRYLFYKPKDDVVFVARRGVFFEREMISKEDSRSKINHEEIQESADEEPIVNTNTQQEVVTPNKISDSTLSELDEPANYKEAMESLEAAKWKEAIKSEI